jgi:hypothetical protein
MRFAEGRLFHELAERPGEARRASVGMRGMWLQPESLRLTGRVGIAEFRPEPYPVE